jgi:hypothetical protein
MSAIEEMIRKRAYELWEQAGCPDGRSYEFWFAARAEIEVQAGTAAGREPGAPVPKSGTPPTPPAPKPARNKSAGVRPGAKPTAKPT